MMDQYYKEFDNEITNLDIYEKLKKFEEITRNVGSCIEICKVCEDFPIIYANEVFYTLIGCEKNEIVNTFENKHSLLLLSSDVKDVESSIKSQLDKSSKYSIEYKIKRKDGNIIWVLDRGAIINLASSKEKIKKIVRVLTDITNQKEKQYGNVLASKKSLTYEANISKDIILNYDQQWAISVNLSETNSFSCMVKEVCETKIATEHISIIESSLSQKEILEAYKNGKKLYSFEYLKKVDEHNYEWFEQTINIIKEELSGDIIIRSYILNISEQKEKELKNIGEQKFYEQMILKSAIIYEINLTKDVVISGYENWKTLFNNDIPSYTKILEEIYNNVIHPEDKDKFYNMFLLENVLLSYQNGEKELNCEYRRLDETDKFIWFRCTIHIFSDPLSGDIKGFLYVDKIDEEKKKEIELIYKAQHDLLTELYNKSTVEEKIESFFATNGAKSSRHAFFIIDLDNFKMVNDSFGHAFGDTVLSKMASKLMTFFRDDDIIGRIGGDEFVVLMKNIKNDRAVKIKADKICKNLKESYIQNGIEYHISVSIGIAFYNTNGTTYKSLYHLSDSALYYSKQQGKNQYSVYKANMDTNLTNIKAIDPTNLINIKNLSNNIDEYIFKILYESTDRSKSINSILELVGKHYNVSRSYIFEISSNKKYINNTFEWCNIGVPKQIDNCQNIYIGDFQNYENYFDENGIYYITDTSNISNESTEFRKILESRNVKSVLQFSIIKNGDFVGLIGYDQCDFARIPSKCEFNDNKTIANILGLFLLEKRAFEKIISVHDSALSIINALDSYAYVCEPDTYELLFINEKILELFPNVKKGDCCYKSFWNNKAPCDGCPMQSLENSISNKFICEIYNPLLKTWFKVSTSWVKWLDDKKVCLIDSTDITAYKKEGE